MDHLNQGGLAREVLGPSSHWGTTFDFVEVGDDHGCWTPSESPFPGPDNQGFEVVQIVVTAGVPSDVSISSLNHLSVQHFAPRARDAAAVGVGVATDHVPVDDARFVHINAVIRSRCFSLRRYTIARPLLKKMPAYFSGRMSLKVISASIN